MLDVEPEESFWPFINHPVIALHLSHVPAMSETTCQVRNVSAPRSWAARDDGASALAQPWLLCQALNSVLRLDH